MCKETNGVGRCACGQAIRHIEYHISHCKPAQDRLLKATGSRKPKKEKADNSFAAVAP